MKVAFREYLLLSGVMEPHSYRAEVAKQPL